MLVLEENARLILTDSGGMQKEAYFFEVPCITLRPETEWLETVESGWNVVVGSDTSGIVEAHWKTTDSPPKRQPDLYGDGRASGRIIQKFRSKTANLDHPGN
jgi:UDP-N-acetylglucosamine 2-epimerase